MADEPARRTLGWLMERVRAIIAADPDLIAFLDSAYDYDTGDGQPKLTRIELGRALALLAGLDAHATDDTPGSAVHAVNLAYAALLAVPIEQRTCDQALAACRNHLADFYEIDTEEVQRIFEESVAADRRATVTIHKRTIN